MLDVYRTTLRTPGAATFCAAGFLMRLPYAMYPLALVLLISTRTGHYSFAGTLSGGYVAGNAVGSPLLARIADARGQRSVLLPATVLHVACVAALVAVVGRLPDWVLLPFGFVAGAAFLSVGSLVRARWSVLLAGRPELATAYSLESTVDELVFVLGPLLATVLATQVDGSAALLCGAALVTVGMLWLRALRASEPATSCDVQVGRAPSALRSRAVRLVTAVTIAIGAVFASAEISMVAFCGQHAAQAAGGIVLACFAFGSATAGLWYGSRHRPAPILARLRRQGLLFGCLPAVLLLAWNVPSLAVCALVAGTAIAPMLITGFGVIEQLATPGTLTEALAWLSTGVGIGYGIGSAVVGRVDDGYGARAGFLVALAAAVTVAVLAAVTAGRLRSSARPLSPRVEARR